MLEQNKVMKVELFIQKKCTIKILQVNEINILTSNFPYNGFIAPFYNQNCKYRVEKGWWSRSCQILVLWVVLILLKFVCLKVNWHQNKVSVLRADTSHFGSACFYKHGVTKGWPI